MLQQLLNWLVKSSFFYFTGQHVRLLEQENRVLWWVCSLSSVRDVGDGGQSGLWGHNRWYQGAKKVAQLNGLVLMYCKYF